mgnify:CR=1 FL=1
MSLTFYSLSSGSKGNCYLVTNGTTTVLVDAGISCKETTQCLQTLGLSPSDINGIIITHGHSDHYKGLDVLAGRHSIPVFTNSATWDEMNPYLKYAFKMKYNLFRTGDLLDIGDLKINTFAKLHDTRDPFGVTVIHQDSRACVLTDIGRMTPAVLREIHETDLLVLESNHDRRMLDVGPYPEYLKARIRSDKGHLSNEDAARTLVELFWNQTRIKQVLLAHLSDENNRPEIALATAQKALHQSKSILKLEVIHQHILSAPYHL